MVYEYISVTTYNQGWDVFDFSFTLHTEVYSFLLLLGWGVEGGGGGTFY